jgi:hypothetical protein
MAKIQASKLIILILTVSMLPACTPQKLVQGSILNLAVIETELKKGVSTKVDVQRVLGSPQGLGGAVFPVTAEQHEVWYYQNIQIDNIVSKQSFVTMDMHQKVLLVFFSKGVFEGFLGFTGTINGEGKK